MKNKPTLKNTLLAIFIGSSLLNLPAFALDDVEHNEHSKAFKSLDTDGNNKLSPKEVKNEASYAKNFKEADGNGDGVLSESEFTNYRSGTEQKNVKRVANDSLITSKVKTNLLKAEGIESMKISVETHHGAVVLSGFLESKAQIDLAEKIATEVEGVKSVKNSLVLRKE